MTIGRPSTPSRRPSEQTVGVILVIISACGFGSSALFVQPLYGAGMDPLTVLFWRFGTAAVFGWGLILLSGRQRLSLRLLPRRRVAVLLGLGVLYVANSYAWIASLQAVPITIAAITTYMYPAIVAVLATRYVRRLEGRRAWVALALSLLGVSLAIGGIPEDQLPPLWAMALALANPLIYGTWIVLQSRVAGDRPVPRSNGDGAVRESPILIPPGDAEAVANAPDPGPAATLMTSATAAVFAILVLATGGSISPVDVPEGTWFAVLGLGLVATAIAIQAFYAGVKRVGGARASLVSTIEPVYTVFFALILFGESLTPIQWLGGGLVIGAVLLAETGRGDGMPDSPTVVADPTMGSTKDIGREDATGLIR